MLDCFCISDLLSPSYSLILPPAATDWLYLSNVVPALQCRGAEGGAHFHFALHLRAAGENASCRAGLHMASRSASTNTRLGARRQVKSVYISPPLFSYAHKTSTTSCCLSAHPPFSFRSAQPLKTSYIISTRLAVPVCRRVSCASQQVWDPKSEGFFLERVK